MRQRLVDLIYAQYSFDLKSLQSFIQKYGIDFWLLNRSAFTPEDVAKTMSLIGENKREDKPAIEEILSRVQRGKMPVLSSYIKTCSVFEDKELLVLQTNCILKKQS